VAGESQHPERIANPTAKRPKVPSKAINILIDKAWEQGWWCKKSGSKHVMMYSPDGKGMVTLPGSPSDHRSIKNSRNLLRKNGLKL
jgi:hypothetical protein